MTAINQLNGTDSLNPADLIPAYIQQNGDARKVSIGLLTEYLRGQFGDGEAKTNQYAAPLTGTTVQVQNGSTWLILTPAGTLAALTLQMPVQSTVTDGQEVLVSTTQTISTLTLTGNGAAIVGAPTTLAANGSFRLRYEPVLKTWYKI
jgi:hypothetical protein